MTPNQGFVSTKSQMKVGIYHNGGRTHRQNRMWEIQRMSLVIVSLYSA
jgi:hypothetical protein